MIDLRREQPLNLITAAKLIPPARNGEKTHLSTLLRWIIHGSKGPDGTIVRLEAMRLGSRWVTSREALMRFMDRLTPNVGEGEEPALPAGSQEVAS
jgi:hypothetical protein